MGQPHLIGIAGASCAGKTTITRRLIGLLPAGETEHISLDSYYYDLSRLSSEAINHHNLDEPAALEAALLIEHVRTLAAGRPVDRPVYDHKTHSRAVAPQRVEPRSFIVIEGLFALYWQEIRHHLGTRVFIDSTHDLCLQRRIERDRNQRGRTTEEVTNRYRNAVQPMFDLHVLPTRRFADIIVNGQEPVDAAASQILSHIRREQNGRR
jgi:uridine kinase